MVEVTGDRSSNILDDPYFFIVGSIRNGIGKPHKTQRKQQLVVPYVVNLSHNPSPTEKIKKKIRRQKVYECNEFGLSEATESSECFQSPSQLFK